MAKKKETTNDILVTEDFSGNIIADSAIDTPIVTNFIDNTIVKQPEPQKDIIQLIIEIAQSYIGQKEIPQNKGFYDKEFQNKMKQMGWLIGQAWCAYFTELVWKEAFKQFDPSKLKILDELFSGSSQATFNNFNKNGKKYGFEVTDKPLPGSIVIWQYLSNATLGHAAILINSDESKGRIYTVEGNTNAGGSREGDVVAAKIRNLTFNPVGNLKLRGFININI